MTAGTNASRDAKRMGELLEMQKQTYLRLKELAATQRDAIDSDSPEQLLQILGRRQKCITELTEINSQLEPFRSRWNTIREQLPVMDRMRVGDLVEEVQQLLESILEKDRGDCDLLKKRTEQFRRNAGNINAGQQLNAAYASQAQPATKLQPHFLDRTDEDGQF